MFRSDRVRDLPARIRAAGNPADDIRREKETPTFREFAEEYLRRSDRHWKPSGRKTVRIYLKARIPPAFGKVALDRIGPEDVAAWCDAASRDKPHAANRVFEILRAMMFRAEDWGLRQRGANPASASPRTGGPASPGSSTRAGAARARARRPGGAVARGRRRKVLNLRWRDIANDAINLPDLKTGPRAVPLGEATRAYIASLPGARESDAFLFPRHAEGRGVYSLEICWRLAGGLRRCKARLVEAA